MSQFKTVAKLCCVALTGAVLAISARADEWNRKTIMTFATPVEIPGVHLKGWGVLPAGTYVFKIMDSQSNRHIVQIFNKDESHLYATILAIPNYRLRPTDRTVMTFAERATGEPQAIRAWFYPGDNSGQEFVYPKKRAVELAKITNQPVLYIPDEVALNIVALVKTPTEPAVIALKEVPLRAVEPTGKDVAITEVITTPPVQTAAHLPKTAGGLPLLALCGAFCLSLSIAMRALCAR